MESIIPIAVWTVIVLTGLAVLTMLLFGIRSATYGKISPIAATIVAIPIVLLVVLGFALGDWDQAGIVTVLIMLGIGAVAMLLSGLRSMLGQ